MHRVAQRFKSRCNNTSISYTDLVQEGIIGLIIAFERFDPTRNVRFSTFANYWIEAKIRRLLDRNTSTIHVTYSAAAIYGELVKKYGPGKDGTVLEVIQKVMDEYAEGRISYDNYTRYIAILLAKSPERYNHLSIDMTRKYQNGSGEQSIPPDSSSISSSITHHFAHDPNIAGNLERTTLIEKMLDRLDKDEQKLVIMYYGLKDQQAHTYEKLALKMKCSKQRIHQQHKKIINKLRLYLKEVGSDDSIDPKELLE